MGIAIIILGLFIVLLIMVIYKLGRIIKAKDANIDAIKAEIEKQKPEWSDDDKKKLNRIYRLIGEAASEYPFATTCRLIGDKEAIDLQDFLRSIANISLEENS